MPSNYGSLYVVATPIGNMGDITLRAIDTLNKVHAIYAEDTRVFRKLADKYDIKTKVFTYNSHATENTHAKILDHLSNGRDVALVSDAGTPGISDPGSLLISNLRKNYPEVPIVPIPGASALIAAVSVSGILGNSFLFAGFLPHKKGRETILKSSISSTVPTVFYESTHRIEAMLNWFAKNSPETKIMLARELTKMFESIRTSTAPEHLEIMKQNPKEIKGEFTVIVYTRR